MIDAAARRGFWARLRDTGFAPIWIGVLVALIAVLAFRSGGEASALQIQGGDPDATDIIFAGHMYSYIEDSEAIFNEIGLLPMDLVVFGGDAIWNHTDENELVFERAIAAAASYASQVLLVRGNHDIHSRSFAERYPTAHAGYSTLNDVVNIVLDTTVQRNEGESCGLDQAQLDMLEEAVNQPATHRIVYMHHALFAHPTYIDSFQPNFPTVCAEDYWEREVLPIIANKVDLVVSGDGGVKSAFRQVEKDGIRYVVSGSPLHDRVRGDVDAVGPVMATFVRIRSQSGELTVDRLTLGSPTLIDETALQGLPTYRVSVDEAQLRDVYADAPFYEIGTPWQLKIESADVADSIQRPLPGHVLESGERIPMTLSVRGNVGNHWETYKKSWDVTFDDPDRRQLKFVKPSDRGYVAQMFLHRLSDAFGVPAPDVDVVRLIVNDHDFGVYLLYEDFDEAFIELAQYPSDTNPAKNEFRDHYTTYQASGSLTSVRAVGGGGDNTEQQLLSRLEITPELFNFIFERDIFARWLALKMYFGDFHQSEADNFRFFLDKSTGRLVMVTWDPFLRPVALETLERTTGLAGTFYANQENRNLTDDYLRQLIDSGPEYRRVLESLLSEYLVIFQNDPAMEVSQLQLERGLNELLERFDANQATLSAFDR